MAGMQPTIIRSHRASLSLHVSRDGEVIVKVPYLAPHFIISRFINAHQDWIDKTLAKVAQRLPKKRTYQEGETFLFLGQEYALVFSTGIDIVAKNGKLFFPKALQFRIQKELERWLIQKAKEIITQRVVEHAKRMKATYKNIFFSDTASKWGTCFADNTLQFNWRLIMTPLLVIDYVVIHELTHTTEKNHQKAFWHRVGQFTPAYRQHRKWLTENAHLLKL